MYAIIVAGSSQHKVTEGEKLRVDLMAGKKKGDTIVFDKVLMVGGGQEGHKVGAPHVAGAKVTATVVDMGKDGEGVKGEKVWALKRFPGKYKKVRGHRQRYTDIKIEKISV